MSCVVCASFVLFDCVFFFFKQKTAYEMRISDWSSDVCSSDLRALDGLGNESVVFLATHGDVALDARVEGQGGEAFRLVLRRRIHRDADFLARHQPRSEEHTSELQSLMRISYAVFCLKKKTKQYTHMITTSASKNTTTDRPQN